MYMDLERGEFGPDQCDNCGTAIKVGTRTCPECVQAIQRAKALRDAPREIPYGESYNREFAALLGYAPYLASQRLIDQNCYVTPYWRAYRLADGRVAVVTQKVSSDVVTFFESPAAWYQAKRTAWYVDPETLRILG